MAIMRNLFCPFDEHVYLQNITHKKVCPFVMHFFFSSSCHTVDSEKENQNSFSCTTCARTHKNARTPAHRSIASFATFSHVQAWPAQSFYLTLLNRVHRIVLKIWLSVVVGAWQTFIHAWAHACTCLCVSANMCDLSCDRGYFSKTTLLCEALW